MDLYAVLKYNKSPDFVASHKSLGIGNWVEEEWYTKDIAIPKWWNDEYHRLMETGKDSYEKFCLRCGRRITENGCEHNL